LGHVKEPLNTGGLKSFHGNQIKGRKECREGGDSTTRRGGKQKNRKVGGGWDVPDRSATRKGKDSIRVYRGKSPVRLNQEALTRYKGLQKGLLPDEWRWLSAWKKISTLGA